MPVATIGAYWRPYERHLALFSHSFSMEPSQDFLTHQRMATELEHRGVRQELRCRHADQTLIKTTHEKNRGADPTAKHVLLGLHKQTMTNIVGHHQTDGFQQRSSLPFFQLGRSRCEPVTSELIGTTQLQVFDATVKALTDAANAINKANPKMLVIADAINWTGVPINPIVLFISCLSCPSS